MSPRQALFFKGALLFLSKKTLKQFEIILAKKSVNGAVTEINTKTEKYLEPHKSLVNFKDNQYWLQYDVNIDG